MLLLDQVLVSYNGLKVLCILHIVQRHVSSDDRLVLALVLLDIGRNVKAVAFVAWV